MRVEYCLVFFPRLHVADWNVLEIGASCHRGPSAKLIPDHEAFLFRIHAETRPVIPTLHLLFTLPLVAVSYSLNSWSLRIMFRATSRLLACRVTFFTRTPCGLCDAAKVVVQNVKSRRPLEYHEINVMDPGQEKWKSLYEFDTPVVRRPGFPSFYMYAMRRVPECSDRSTSTRPELERPLSPRSS